MTPAACCMGASAACRSGAAGLSPIGDIVSAADDGCAGTSGTTGDASCAGREVSAGSGSTAGPGMGDVRSLLARTSAGSSGRVAASFWLAPSCTASGGMAELAGTTVSGVAEETGWAGSLVAPNGPGAAGADVSASCAEGDWESCAALSGGGLSGACTMVSESEGADVEVADIESGAGGSGASMLGPSAAGTAFGAVGIPAGEAAPVAACALVSKDAFCGGTMKGLGPVADRPAIGTGEIRAANVSAAPASVSAPPIAPGATAAGRLAATGVAPARAGNGLIIKPL